MRKKGCLTMLVMKKSLSDSNWGVQNQKGLSHLFIILRKTRIISTLAFELATTSYFNMWANYRTTDFFNFWTQSILILNAISPQIYNDLLKSVMDLFFDILFINCINFSIYLKSLTVSIIENLLLHISL